MINGPMFVRFGLFSSHVRFQGLGFEFLRLEAKNSKRNPAEFRSRKIQTLPIKKHLEGLGLNFSQKVSMEIADAVLKMSATKCTIKRKPPSDQRLDYTYISSQMLRNKRIQDGMENVHSYQ